MKLLNYEGKVVEVADERHDRIKYPEPEEISITQAAIRLPESYDAKDHLAYRYRLRFWYWWGEHHEDCYVDESWTIVQDGERQPSPEALDILGPAMAVKIK